MTLLMLAAPPAGAITIDSSRASEGPPKKERPIRIIVDATWVFVVATAHNARVAVMPTTVEAYARGVKQDTQVFLASGAPVQGILPYASNQASSTVLLIGEASKGARKAVQSEIQAGQVFVAQVRKALP